MFRSLNYPICSCWYRDLYFFHSVFSLSQARSEFSSAASENEGCSKGELKRLAHILNIKQANCKEETFLPLRARRRLPSILILPSCPPAIRHTLSEASQQLQPCLKSSNRANHITFLPQTSEHMNGEKLRLSKY